MVTVRTKLQMKELIPISKLNDFDFCPYSIYLQNVYMDTDEDLYRAQPQTRGNNAHEKVDKKTTSTARNVIESLPIISHELGVFGKIDVYDSAKKRLIERKYSLKNLFRGKYYQLWAQYFCLIDMGYKVDIIDFYEISTHKTINDPLPGDKQKNELTRFIENYLNFDPKIPINVNHNKCTHCIYCNLCDKTDEDNVYS